MSTWIALRLAKFLGLAALTVGLGLAAGSGAQRDRARAALWIAAPALWVTYVAGFLLLTTTGRSLASPFALTGALAGLVALHGAVLSASKGVPPLSARALPLAGLGAAIAVMVARDLPHGVTLIAAAGGAATGATLALALPAADEGYAGWPADVRRFVQLTGRAVGVSLLLMAVAGPMRRAGMPLDGGTGAIGWGHGVLWVLYLQAVLAARRPLRWSWGTVALALFASVVPFGTFVFERRAP